MSDEIAPSEVAKRKSALAIYDASLAIWEMSKLVTDPHALQYLERNAGDIYGMRRRLDGIISSIEARRAA